MIHKSNYMTARIWIKRIVSMIGTITLFTYGLCYCNWLLINKSSYNRYASFFDSERDYDVLFFGSSHVHNGVSQLYLYHKYKIASYNASADGNYISSNYYLLKEFLKSLERERRQLPETIVVDIYPAEESKDRLQIGWDSLPFFSYKLEMANALVSKEDRFEILFPFSLYHGRWNGLSKDDFLPKVNQLYGQGIFYGLSYPDSEIITNPLDQTEVDEETADYIDRMKAECEEYGIQLILIHIPYSYRPDLQRKANGICKYAEEQGIRCVNYMNMDTAIDYDIDFCDTGHLNIAGARIMTDELGRLLSGIALEDHSLGEEDEIQAGYWEQAYETYIQVLMTGCWKGFC